MGVGVMSIWDTFDLIVSRVSLVSFSALVSKWHVTQKQLAIEQNESILGLRVNSRPYNGYL